MKENKHSSLTQAHEEIKINDPFMQELKHIPLHEK